MPKEPWKLALPFLRIDRSRGALEQQLYRQMRSAITDGRLPAGLRMPSSRQFAVDLGVSRNTVLAVFERLTSEGLLQSKTGSGTFIAAVRAPRIENTTPLALSSWAEEVDGMDEWRNAAPAADLFPAERWAQYVAAQWRHRALSPKSDIRGDAGLRLAIADHVAPMSGIVCEPDNVLITSGLQQALDCIARALIDPGDTVLVEDPLNAQVRRSLQSARAELLPNRTDAEGMLPDFLDGTARLAYVSASSQNPMGAALSTLRQFLLIEWAKKNGVVVIENADAAGIDTTDRELSLKMIDTRGVVLSIGSFETTLSPEVGIGYIIGTQTKITQLAKVRSSYGTLPPAPEQRALQEFLTRGDFAAHLKRQRQVYIDRYEAFARELQTHLGGRIVGVTKSAALRLTVWLPPDADEATLADAFHAVGIRCRPMSAFTVANRLSPAVVVDYGTIAAETAPVLAHEIANQLRPSTDRNVSRVHRDEPRRGEDRVA